MNRCYYVVRPIVMGFEFSFIVYGTKEEMIEYIRKHFMETSYSYFQLPDECVDIVINKLNTKVYMCNPLFVKEPNRNIEKFNKFTDTKE